MWMTNVELCCTLANSRIDVIRSWLMVFVSQDKRALAYVRSVSWLVKLGLSQGWAYVQSN